MSLDKNLFTLNFTANKDHPNVVDLVDPSGIVHYRKQRVPSAEYKMEVYDPMSESLLAIATAVAASSKTKTLELCNPTSVVELKYTGTLSFRWAFKWEEHEFEWKREECYMIRKPDPPVIIAVTKEPAGRLKTISVQILDYNLNRFDINDRKGLEIVILTALMTFHDANDAYHTPEASSSTPASNPPNRNASGETPPPPPPKPAPRTGVDRIAELQAMKGEYNEIIISDEGNIQEYAEYCNKLLQDDAMLFVTVKSAEAEHVPKVLQVVEETKRIRHKAGLSDQEELHQYVLYDTQDTRKGPRRINLDDGAKNKYTPPKNLTVHLSKISMPELQPKANSNDKPQKDSKRKDDKKTSGNNPPRIAPPTPRPFGMSDNPSRPTGFSSRPYAPTNDVNIRPPPNKLQRPGRAPSPNPPRVHPHQKHPGPNQPSPSPTQINNPSIYAAPPPRPINTNAQRPPISPNVPPFPQPSTSNWTRPGGFNGPYPGTAPNFPPSNWSGAGAPPPGPPPTQPPESPASNKPLSVVHGLMDLLSNRR